MDSFEDRLRKALREPQPTPDLWQRVLARTAVTTSRHRWLPAVSLGRAAAVAVAVVGLGILSFMYYRNAKERMENEHAQQQLITVFRLAEEQLRPLQRQLLEAQEVTVPLSKE